jgi:hypothetical protein
VHIERSSFKSAASVAALRFDGVSEVPCALCGTVAALQSAPCDRASV